MAKQLKQTTYGTPNPRSRGALKRPKDGSLVYRGAYGRLLRALSQAQAASDRAAARAASRADRGEVKITAHNYVISSEARDADLAALEAYLGTACDLLPRISWVTWGWLQLPLEYDHVYCRRCDGTGQDTECDFCDGQGTQMADKKCGACLGSGARVCQVCAGDGENLSGGLCAHCHGEGIGDCERCDGSGRRIIGEVDCDDCHGSGEADPVVCPICDGSGISALLARPRCWLLCIDLPSGQVTFRCAARGEGPRYQGAWDETPGTGAVRIFAAIEELEGLLRGKTNSRLALMAWASVA